MNKSLVNRLKANNDPNVSFELPVSMPDEKLIGSLRLIDSSRSCDVSLVSNLTRWRRGAMRCFLSQFDATEGRTRDWLERVVMRSDDRLLFEVLDEKGRPVGNAGVCNLSESAAELDNFVRGEPGGDANLFVAAERVMLKWLFFDLGVQKVTLHVFSNNWIPISNHMSFGFSVTRGYSLYKVEEDGEISHLLDDKRGPSVSYRYLEMTLLKESFRKSFGDAGVVKNVGEMK